MFAGGPKALLAQLARFGLVGLLNTVLGLALIYAFKWGWGWGDALANMAGYALCIGLGFVLNGRWTFAHSALGLRQLWGYLGVVGLAYLLNLLTVLAAIRWLAVPGDWAQLLGVPVFTLVSFVLNRQLVFAKAG